MRGSLVNHDKKLVWIFLPKCAGSSTWQYLMDLGGWEKAETKRIDTEVIVPKKYTVFCIGRDPKEWLISGYRMFKERHDLPWDFSKNLELINLPYFLLARDDYDYHDWYWHNGISPDQHIIKYPKIRKFKLEQKHLMQEWLATYFPGSENNHYPWENKTQRDEKINWTAADLRNANAKMYRYCHLFGYPPIVD